MSGWWDHAVTNGDLLLYVFGFILGRGTMKFAAGFREGWKRDGKSFREGVRDRVKVRRGL